MEGGDRAGYKQISRDVDAVVITSTMGATTMPWNPGAAYFEVISSEAAIALVTSDGISNSSLISSGTALPQGSIVGGGPITGITISGDSTGHKVMAYRRILL